MVERVLVTGGTGLLGRQVVEQLQRAGHGARVMSRRARPAEDTAPYEWVVADPRSGRGLTEAVEGADTIVHCATALGRREPELARRLVEAASRAGRPHLVYISITGVDRVPLGYYRAKLAAERVIEGSALPYTILRATQFHDLLREILAGSAKAPVMLVPRLAFQPVDAGEVAARLAGLAAGEPAGRVPDFAGPRVCAASELARAYLSATGRRRPVLPVALPGKVFRAYRDGAHLAPDHTAGTITFEHYLAEHPAPRGLSYRGTRR